MITLVLYGTYSPFRTTPGVDKPIDEIKPPVTPPEQLTVVGLPLNHYISVLSARDWWAKGGFTEVIMLSCCTVPSNHGAYE